jgi:hypothetical protein
LGKHGLIVVDLHTDVSMFFSGFVRRWFGDVQIVFFVCPVGEGWCTLSMNTDDKTDVS